MNEKVENGEFKLNVEYIKRELHGQFLDAYEDYQTDIWLRKTGNFTKYLKLYAKYSLKAEPRERRSNSNSLILFFNNNEN